MFYISSGRTFACEVRQITMCFRHDGLLSTHFSKLDAFESWWTHPLKQIYYNHQSSFAYEIYRHKTSLSNYVWQVKNKFGIDLILKWEIVKRCSKHKEGDRYCKLCRGEKLTQAPYNKPKELLNQRSKIFDICKHLKNWLVHG